MFCWPWARPPADGRLRRTTSTNCCIYNVTSWWVARKSETCRGIVTGKKTKIKWCIKLVSLRAYIQEINVEGNEEYQLRSNIFLNFVHSTGIQSEIWKQNSGRLQRVASYSRTQFCKVMYPLIQTCQRPRKVRPPYSGHSNKTGRFTFAFLVPICTQAWNIQQKSTKMFHFSCRELF
jgi:hypothetical protein